MHMPSSALPRCHPWGVEAGWAARHAIQTGSVTFGSRRRIMPADRCFCFLLHLHSVAPRCSKSFTLGKGAKRNRVAKVQNFTQSSIRPSNSPRPASR